MAKMPLETLEALLEQFNHLEGQTIQHVKTQGVYRVVCVSINEGLLPDEIFVEFVYETVGPCKVRFTRPINELSRFVPYYDQIN